MPIVAAPQSPPIMARDCDIVVVGISNASSLEHADCEGCVGFGKTRGDGQAGSSPADDEKVEGATAEVVGVAGRFRALHGGSVYAVLSKVRRMQMGATQHLYTTRGNGARRTLTQTIIGDKRKMYVLRMITVVGAEPGNGCTRIMAD
jgi:hypothetical protein